MGVKFCFERTGYKVIADCGVLKKNVLKSIFGADREKAAGDWKKKKQSNEEIQLPYYLLNILTIKKLRRMKCEGCADRTRETRNPLKILFAKHEQKVELVRQPSRWVYNWILQR